jgi:hypothetical protein
MPIGFRSKAQIRKFQELVARGDIEQATFDNWMAATKRPGRLPERVKKKKKVGMKKAAFVEGFLKVASGVTAAETAGAKASKGIKSWLQNPEKRKKLYYGLEMGGLGALTANDAHDAYKAHKEGDKGHRNKALLNTGALGGLMAATHIAH